MKKLILLLIFIFSIGFFNQTAQAATASYSLTAPDGPFNRGDNIDFTISIDTNGQTLSSATIGMTYDTQYLEYVSTTPGDAFSSVNATTQEGGKVVFDATNTEGFSGSGTFATVTFKLIASAPGSTELCVLYTPSSTPTSAPQPTALPKTGSMNQVAQGIIVGVAIILVLSSSFMLINKPAIKNPHKHKA